MRVYLTYFHSRNRDDCKILFYLHLECIYTWTHNTDVMA